MIEAKWARDLGRRLRALRVDRALTQEGLAEGADLHPGYVQKIESGERLPSLATLVRLARALDVPVSAVVSVLDDGVDPEGLGAVGTLLQGTTPRELALIRDFIHLLRRHRRDD